MPPFPSLTKQWHSKAYPAIDPTRSELSARGKIVAITGGGGTIGAATALAFAKAGSQTIAIIGRRVEPLKQTKDEVEKAVPDAHVLVVQADLSNASSMKQALSTIAEKFGKIDILVANAGYLSRLETITDSDPDEWWTGFEINCKGAFNTIRAFLPVAGPKPLIIDVSSCVVHITAMAQGSGYVSSKLAAIKIYETAAVENHDLSVVHIHPGVIYSELNAKSGFTPFDDGKCLRMYYIGPDANSMTPADLAGNFILWAVSSEAEFLRGKYLWANWDVDELKQRRDELSKPDQLTITMNGWPFGQDATTDALKF